jgi:hypothetical protein
MRRKTGAMVALTALLLVARADAADPREVRAAIHAGEAVSGWIRFSYDCYRFAVAQG